MDSRKVKQKEGDKEETLGEIINNLCGGNDSTTLVKLLDFKTYIDKELFEFEFHCFPSKEGKISCEDFAKSMLCYLEPKKVGYYMKLMKNTEFKGTVSSQEYSDF